MSENDGAENRQGQGNLPRMYYRTWYWRKDYQAIFGNPDRQFEHRVRRALDYLEQRKAVTKHSALTLVRKEEENSAPLRPAPLSEAALSNWHVDYRTVFGNLDGQFDKRLDQARRLLKQGQALSRYEALLRVREAEESSSSHLDQAGSQLEAPSSPAPQEELAAYIHELTGLNPTFQRYYYKKTTSQIRFVLPPGFRSPNATWVTQQWLTITKVRELSILILTAKGLKVLDTAFTTALIRWCRVREWMRIRKMPDAPMVLIDKDQAQTVLQGFEKTLPLDGDKVRVEVTLDALGYKTPASPPPADKGQESPPALSEPTMFSKKAWKRWRLDYRTLFGQVDERFDQRVQQARTMLDQGQAASRFEALATVRQMEEGAAMKPLSMPDADSSRPGQKTFSTMGYRKWRAAYLGIFGGIDEHFNRRLEQARLLLRQGQAGNGFQALSQVRWMEEGTTNPRPSQDEGVQVPGTEANRIDQLEAKVTKLEQDIRALYIWKHWSTTRLTHLADMYSTMRKTIREPSINSTDQTHLLLVEIRDTLRRLEQAVEAAFRRC